MRLDHCELVSNAKQDTLGALIVRMNGGSHLWCGLSKPRPIIDHDGDGMEIRWHR